MLSVQTETTRQVLSVSDLTRSVRFLLEQHFSSVWVEGEICNFKWHSSGHMYFSLKDEQSQVQCVMFKRENNGLGFELSDGMQIVCGGRVSVYGPRGQYQLYVERIEPKGAGALQLRFEQLKEKLKNEGLFDAAHKVPIPYLPETIGIVTSKDGAALRDILHVLDRRFSGVEIFIYPVAVQGKGAAEDIASAIDDFNRAFPVDVLIVARGGGSLEDLWAFNEETVARAIYRSEIPVISAVGHEIDFTIADFVADIRAATPSVAAEIVMPVKEELASFVGDLETRASLACLSFVKSLRQELKRLSTNRALRDPLAVFEIQSQRLDELARSMLQSLSGFIRFQKQAVAGLLGRLEVLGPASTLARGFSVSLKLPREKVVLSSAGLKPGDRVKTLLSRGFFVSQVIKTNLRGQTPIGQNLRGLTPRPEGL